MLKKFIALGVLIVMVSSFAACGRVSLADYKISGKAKIDAHFAIKTQNDYCPGKWAEVCNAVVEGKQAVEDATNKSEVDTAVETAKTSIDRIKNDAEIAEISTIHFYTAKSTVLLEKHQLYDFKAKTYSTKPIGRCGSAAKEV